MNNKILTNIICKAKRKENFKYSPPTFYIFLPDYGPLSLKPVAILYKTSNGLNKT